MEITEILLIKESGAKLCVMNFESMILCSDSNNVPGRTKHCHRMQYTDILWNHRYLLRKLKNEWFGLLNLSQESDTLILYTSSNLKRCEWLLHIICPCPWERKPCNPSSTRVYSILIKCILSNPWKTLLVIKKSFSVT